MVALLGGKLLSPAMLKAMKTPGELDGRKYGIGLVWRTAPCGITVYGNDGAIAYQARAFAAEDPNRRASAASPQPHDDTVPKVWWVLNIHRGRA